MCGHGEEQEVHDALEGALRLDDLQGSLEAEVLRLCQDGFLVQVEDVRSLNTVIITLVHHIYQSCGSGTGRIRIIWPDPDPYRER